MFFLHWHIFFSAIASFALRMFEGVYVIFALMINFLGNDWQPKHVTIGLFDVTNNTGQTLVRSLTMLLDKYGLRKKIIAYVKDKGSNINAMTVALKVVVNCEFLGLEESFQGTCFGHAFSKGCQYDIVEEKVCKDLKHVYVKFVQVDLQKCIIWLKKQGKQEWNKTYVKTSICPPKLKTLVKTRQSLLFQQFTIFGVLNYVG